jgi:hypothetical protein
MGGFVGQSRRASVSDYHRKSLSVICRINLLCIRKHIALRTPYKSSDLGFLKKPGSNKAKSIVIEMQNVLIEKRSQQDLV